jgi:hypothetical protein
MKSFKERIDSYFSYVNFKMIGIYFIFFFIFYLFVHEYYVEEKTFAQIFSLRNILAASLHSLFMGIGMSFWNTCLYKPKVNRQSDAK